MGMSKPSLSGGCPLENSCNITHLRQLHCLGKRPPQRELCDIVEFIGLDSPMFKSNSLEVERDTSAPTSLVGLAAWKRRNY